MTLISLLKKIGSLTKDLIVLCILVALFAASVFGVKTPPQKSVKFPPYQISLFDSGIAIYADGRKTPYWSISPLNDYILTFDGERKTLLTGAEFNEGKYATNLKRERLEELQDTLRYFQGINFLVYEMKKTDMEVTYKVTKEGSNMNVERSLKALTPGKIAATGITVSFTGSDLVYEPGSNTFIYYQDMSDVSNFAKFLDAKVNLYQGREGEYLVTVDSGNVVLVNKYLPGAILITAGKDQRLIVDTRYGVILTEQQVGQLGDIKTRINLTVFDNPEELAKSL